MTSEEARVFQPKPRRPFTTSPIDTEVPSPVNEPASPQSGATSPLNSSQIAAFQASRTHSILNLTASTLYGIYAPDDDASVLGYTPLPTDGHTTPAYSHSQFDFERKDRETDRMAPVIGAMERPQFRATPSYQRANNQGSTLARAGKGIVRAALLFALGVAYGTVVTHLHDTRNVAPVKIDGLDRSSPSYFIFWGMAGVLLGTALPVVDAIWEGESPEEKRERILLHRSFAAAVSAGGSSIQDDANRQRQEDGSAAVSPLAEAIGLGAEWNPIVRSIGAFIGIGFAIRRLPWQSTWQASLTLGLANPCLWYTIDRSLPGFALSSLVGLLGTMVLLGTEVVPMPTVVQAAARSRAGRGNATSGSPVAGLPILEHLPLEIDQGTFAVWVWIASVLFCSCLCFGNIGRRLALGMKVR